MSFLEGMDVRRPGRVADLLARAMRQRAVGATATNEHSSRSHMVFSLNITGSNAASGQQVHGKPPVTIYTAMRCIVQTALSCSLAGVQTVPGQVTCLKDTHTMLSSHIVLIIILHYTHGSFTQFCTYMSAVLLQ